MRLPICLFQPAIIMVFDLSVQYAAIQSVYSHYFHTIILSGRSNGCPDKIMGFFLLSPTVQSKFYTVKTKSPTKTDLCV